MIRNIFFIQLNLINIREGFEMKMEGLMKVDMIIRYLIDLQFLEHFEMVMNIR